MELRARGLASPYPKRNPTAAGISLKFVSLAPALIAFPLQILVLFEFNNNVAYSSSGVRVFILALGYKFSNEDFLALS